MRKILIAEDNVEISEIMRGFLIKAGLAVYQAFDGGEAVTLAQKLEPDLILLDIMMPVKDGLTVCREIRATSKVPIIVISAKVTEEDKIRMLEAGADDYMTKPFSYREMVVRVNAQLRRFYDFGAGSEDSHKRVCGVLTIDLDSCEVSARGKKIALTAKEYKLLDCFSANPGKLFNKQKLIDEVWGMDEYIDENTVAVTIARLRSKLEAEGVNCIVTVWGMGYKWLPEVVNAL